MNLWPFKKKVAILPARWAILEESQRYTKLKLSVELPELAHLDELLDAGYDCMHSERGILGGAIFVCRKTQNSHFPSLRQS